MIYLIEDDDSIRDLLVYTLNTMGMKTIGFARPSAFWEQMKRELPEMLLLDIMLPEQDGLSILRQLRSQSSTAMLPIIMLTAKDTEYDRVVGLDQGADDYIAKPFGMMELVARIRALRRRTSPVQEQDDYIMENLYVCPAKHIVKVEGKEITLSLKEFELLCCLLRHPQTVLTRDRLFNEIWGYDFDGESRTVDVHIRYLRQKLGVCGDLIKTVRGIGYKIGVSEV